MRSVVCSFYWLEAQVQGFFFRKVPYIIENKIIEGSHSVVQSAYLLVEGSFLMNGVSISKSLNAFKTMISLELMSFLQITLAIKLIFGNTDGECSWSFSGRFCWTRISRGEQGHPSVMLGKLFWGGNLPFRCVHGFIFRMCFMYSGMAKEDKN